MGVFALNHTSERIDQAISAVHSGLFPNGSGIVYQSGNQSLFNAKTFFGNLIARSGFNASGNVSGRFSPHNDGLVDLGETGNRFGMVYATGVSGTSAYFGGNVVIAGTLSANININTTGVNTITSTGTGFFQNIRVTGTTVLGGSTTISGNINSSGNNVFAGQNTFQSTSNFQDPVFFEDASVFSGVSTVRGAATFHSNVSITSGSFTHSGLMSLTGTFAHTGSIFQNGPSSLTGNLFINGDTSVTGNLNVVNGTTTIRSSTLFTTGSSASDRLRIIQNVDQTGDFNLTGSLRVSNDISVTGNATIRGASTVGGTGYFSGVRSSGSLNASGSNTLTGTNNLHGSNFVSGSTRISGDLTVVAATGNFTRFDGYFRPFVVAQGFGTTSVASLTVASFWTTTGTPTALGREVCTTAYTGRLGEIGLLLTGASNTVANNNSFPLGTYGKVFNLVNVGTQNGSGIWYPIGL